MFCLEKKYTCTVSERTYGVVNEKRISQKSEIHTRILIQVSLKKQKVLQTHEMEAP